jgi:hypothetical protein
MKRAQFIPLLAFALASCGTNSGFIDGSGPPSGAGELVLRVQTAGGFVPPGADQVAVPEFTLMGDGRIVTSGPQVELYPGPALPNMQQRTVSRDGIDAIMAEARDAGLLGPDKHYGYDTVADAGTTFFITVSDGERHVVSAYALGLDAGPSPNTTAADREARAELQRFRERLGDLTSWLPQGSLGEEEPYEFDALRVVVRAGADNPDDGVRANDLDWPLSSLENFGAQAGDTRCGIVGGNDLAEALPLVRQATQITLWHSEGETYTLQFRPQLPDENACEVPQGTGG